MQLGQYIAELQRLERVYGPEIMVISSNPAGSMFDAAKPCISKIHISISNEYTKAKLVSNSERHHLVIRV